jgi:hypothetical protein
MYGDMTWNDGEANNYSDGRDVQISPVSVNCVKARGCSELVVDIMDVAVGPLGVQKAVDPVGEIVFQQSVNHQLCYYLTRRG